MPVQKLTIQQFIELSHQYPVLDVRSPGEYKHAHIPGAYSLPLFTDEERKVVGTAYKQQSREKAIKVGLDYFGVKMRKMVEEVEMLIVHRSSLTERKTFETNNGQPTTANILVHCWRGGMRSAGVAWLLDLYGFKVCTLAGGYKAYRKWVRAQFEKEYNLTVLGGYTGSGKTEVLHQLKAKGRTIIDLEALANHRGSAFGALGEQQQPTQEMFENLLAEALIGKEPYMNSAELSTANTFWIEDESQRIGNLQIPMPFWYSLRKSPVCFIEIPFEERLEYLTNEYGKFEKEKLVNAIIRIQKRLGGLETKNAVNFLLEDNCKECFRILLKYYDKWYIKGLYNRDKPETLLNRIKFDKPDAKQIASLLTSEVSNSI